MLMVMTRMQNITPNITDMETPLARVHRTSLQSMVCSLSQGAMEVDDISISVGQAIRQHALFQIFRNLGAQCVCCTRSPPNVVPGFQAGAQPKSMRPLLFLLVPDSDIDPITITRPKWLSNFLPWRTHSIKSATFVGSTAVPYAQGVC